MKLRNLNYPTMSNEPMEWKLDAHGLKFAIVVARFNHSITEKLLEGARDALNRAGAESFEVFHVPGSFELPLAAKRAALSKKYDAIVALGCVLRGETPHFEYISNAATNGLEQVALETGIPIGFGVLTVDKVEQAMERSGDSGNKGFEAATTALEMINVLRQI